MRPKHYKLLRPFGPGVFQINTHECSIYLQMDVTGLPELGEKDGLDTGVNSSTCEEGFFLLEVG